MTQLIYKYDKCIECGQEGFQWGAVIEYTIHRKNENNEWRLVTDHIFVCHECIKTIDVKLDDLEQGAERRAMAEKLGSPFKEACED